jgi:hypothetical protein
VNTGTGTTPVPLKFTVVDGAPPLELKVIAPVLLPELVGLKVTVMLQELPTNTWVPQVWMPENCPVGLLDRVMLLAGKATVPVFTTVSTCCTEVFTVWLPKLKAAGVRV